ncbi:hypothetical protein, partial [Plasmodium yoelii yoelii]
MQDEKQHFLKIVKRMNILIFSRYRIGFYLHFTFYLT